MILKDYHVHTNFSDGKCTPEEVILAAIAMGMTEIGISDHGYTDRDLSYCMKKEDIPAYQKTLHELAEKYRDQISVRCGIEQDYISNESTENYDYVIGSLHYVEADGLVIPVDENADILIQAAQEHFDGDIYALLEKYYETEAKVVEKTDCDIIGHFDLICKTNERNPFFDEKHPRYIAAWKNAADALLKTGVPFEINTGAISRGYKTDPYPTSDVYQYLKEQGARFILSSDAHHKDNLCYQFETYANRANFSLVIE